MLVPDVNEAGEPTYDFIPHPEHGLWNYQPIRDEHLVPIGDQDLGYITAFKDMAHEVFALEWGVSEDFIFISQIPRGYIFMAMVKCGARGAIGLMYFVRWHVLPRVFRQSTGY